MKANLRSKSKTRQIKPNKKFVNQTLWKPSIYDANYEEQNAKTVVALSKNYIPINWKII